MANHVTSKISRRLLQNLAIDAAAIGTSLVLLRNDLKAQEARLRRLSIGAQIAALKVRLQEQTDDAIVPLAALRRGRGRAKRIVIVCGGKECVEKSVQSSYEVSDQLKLNDVLLVPLIIRKRGASRIKSKSKKV